MATITVELEDSQIQEIFDDMGREEKLEWAWAILEEDEEEEHIVRMGLEAMSSTQTVAMVKEVLDDMGENQAHHVRAIFEHAMNRLQKLGVIENTEAA